MPRIRLSGGIVNETAGIYKDYPDIPDGPHPFFDRHNILPPPCRSFGSLHLRDLQGGIRSRLQRNNAVFSYGSAAIWGLVDLSRSVQLSTRRLHHSPALQVSSDRHSFVNRPASFSLTFNLPYSIAGCAPCRQMNDVRIAHAREEVSAMNRMKRIVILNCCPKGE